MTIQNDARRQPHDSTLRRVVRPILASLGLIDREELIPTLSRWRGGGGPAAK